jgi:hydrogenase expression/formation protein HypE
VATALNEIAEQSNVGISLFEDQLPIPGPVSSSCEILGIDPLYVANEGKCLVIAPEKDCEQLLKAMIKQKYGRDSRIIGHITGENRGKVLLKTKIGGTRILTTMEGEPLPRIC